MPGEDEVGTPFLGRRDDLVRWPFRSAPMGRLVFAGPFFHAHTGPLHSLRSTRIDAKGFSGLRHEDAASS